MPIKRTLMERISNAVGGKENRGSHKGLKEPGDVAHAAAPITFTSPNRTVAARLHLCRQTEGSGCMCRNRDALLQSEVQ